jgi:hypothetical protein
MNATLKTVKNVHDISADDLVKMLRAGKSFNNKAAFLKAARGIMTENEATEMLKIIDDAFGRIDE